MKLSFYEALNDIAPGWAETLEEINEGKTSEESEFEYEYDMTQYDTCIVGEAWKGEAYYEFKVPNDKNPLECEDCVYHANRLDLAFKIWLRSGYLTTEKQELIKAINQFKTHFNKAKHEQQIEEVEE